MPHGRMFRAPIEMMRADPFLRRAHHEESGKPIGQVDGRVYSQLHQIGIQ